MKNRIAGRIITPTLLKKLESIANAVSEFNEEYFPSKSIAWTKNKEAFKRSIRDPRKYMSNRQRRTYDLALEKSEQYELSTIKIW